MWALVGHQAHSAGGSKHTSCSVLLCAHNMVLRMLHSLQAAASCSAGSILTNASPAMTEQSENKEADRKSWSTWEVAVGEAVLCEVKTGRYDRAVVVDIADGIVWVQPAKRGKQKYVGQSHLHQLCT